MRKDTYLIQKNRHLLSYVIELIKKSEVLYYKLNKAFEDF